MRRSVVYLCILLFATAFLAGCAAYSVSPVTGFMYTDVKGPVTATAEKGHTKVGVASCVSYLGLIGVGDASIEAAMKNGGITKVQHVDYESKGILGIYAEFKVIVYGE